MKNHDNSVEVKKVYKLFGVPIWSVSIKEIEQGTPKLQASDNGGDTTTNIGFHVSEDDVNADRTTNSRPGESASNGGPISIDGTVFSRYDGRYPWRG